MTSPQPAPARSAFGRNTLPMGTDRLAAEIARAWRLRVVHCPAPVGDLGLWPAKIRIGREAEAGADLVLPDPSVSRVHAALTHVAGDDTLTLEDCDSSNGVFLNGRRV